MLTLEDLREGKRLQGLAGHATITVVAVERFGEASANLVYRGADGRLDQQLVFANDLARLSVANEPQTWSFDADGDLFSLAAEARRIRYAHLFDRRLAVHLSRIRPLPHQIQAVYGVMLDKQPLRFCLADDPGAGKTVMAGLLAKELMLRGDVKRCLVVAPGGLVAQWQDEMDEKFGLSFEILTNETIEAARGGDPFGHRDLLIARLDHLARSDDLIEAARASEWDLVIVDEAHRMSAHWFGDQLTETRRYRLGKALGEATRHLLLMTATPHSGKEEDFQAFLKLLDADLFEGRPRAGARRLDVSEHLRRMVKEDLLTFEGTRLFPERRASTVPYPLSPEEANLYEEVTEYVRNEMNRADRLQAEGQGGRGNQVGFAVTVLQRRLASSPEAIYRSLSRRRARLESRLAEERSGANRTTNESGNVPADFDDELDELEDLADDEIEKIEEELVDRATAARTLEELEAEIATLARLEGLADRVRRRAEHSKWREFEGLLSDEPEMFHADGSRRKLIVFTEHRDTLNYLVERTRALLGSAEAVIAIHGGTPRLDRRRLQGVFTHDPTCVVMIATDAAGEGINLQRAHLLVNYDLPWNPNRIEQRFGRVHRIGQEEVCHMWNLVADQTREGQVFSQLLTKLDVQRRALGGRVFDVLGDAFPGRALRDLLIQAIRYGNQPEKRAELSAVVDERVGEGLRELLEENALAADVLGEIDVERIRRDMADAEAERLQPRYVRDWFTQIFAVLGGRMAEREDDRYEITYVPIDLRSGSRSAATLPSRYERVTFEVDRIQRDGRPPAELLAPGHPLVETLIDAVERRYGSLLRQGATLVAEGSSAGTPWVLVMLEHAITDGRNDRRGEPTVVSRRFQFVEIDASGHASTVVQAPYLDYRPITSEERAACEPALIASFPVDDVEAMARAHAIDVAVTEHLAQVRTRRVLRVEKLRVAVHERLTRQILQQQSKESERREQADAGRQPRSNPDRAAARVAELQDRLRARMAELDREQQIRAQPPIVVGAALVIPGGLIRQAMGVLTPPFVIDPVEVDRRAVAAVLDAEDALGFDPREQPHNHPGFDIRSTGPGTVRFLEVKGRVSGAEWFFVSRNQVLHAQNKPDSFILAMVDVSPLGPRSDRVRYVAGPFATDVRLPSDARGLELPWGPYWERGADPAALAHSAEDRAWQS